MCLVRQKRVSLDVQVNNAFHLWYSGAKFEEIFLVVTTPPKLQVLDGAIVLYHKVCKHIQIGAPIDVEFQTIQGLE